MEGGTSFNIRGKGLYKRCLHCPVCTFRAEESVCSHIRVPTQFLCQTLLSLFQLCLSSCLCFCLFRQLASFFYLFCLDPFPVLCQLTTFDFRSSNDILFAVCLIRCLGDGRLPCALRSRSLILVMILDSQDRNLCDYGHHKIFASCLLGAFLTSRSSWSVLGKM